jgi:hypothetical protein
MTRFINLVSIWAESRKTSRTDLIENEEDERERDTIMIETDHDDRSKDR